jgi:hypothetical protein
MRCAAVCIINNDKAINKAISISKRVFVLCDFVPKSGFAGLPGSRLLATLEVKGLKCYFHPPKRFPKLYPHLFRLPQTANHPRLSHKAIGDPPLSPFSF